MAAIKVKADYSFTIEREAVYGTPAQATPVGLPTEDMIFTQEPNGHRLNRSWGFRGQHEANTWQDTFAVVPGASTSVIMTPQLMALMLPGILQKRIDWAPVADVFTMHTNNFADLPLPKGASEGYFYTLTRNSQIALNDERIVSAIPSSVKLTVAPMDNEGILMADWEFVGTKLDRKITASGSISHAELTDMFKWGDIKKVSFGAADLTADFVSAEINITNGAKLVSDIPTGEYVFPRWEVTATVKVIANSVTEAIKDKILLNDVNSAESLVIAFGNATTPAAEGDLILKMHAYATSYNSEYEEGEVIEFTFQAVFGGGLGEYPFEAKFFHDTTP